MRTLGRVPRLLLLVSAWASSSSPLLAAGADEVVVPGGAAAVRRLLKLPTDRPDTTLFLDLHRRLSVHGDASWSDVEPRRRLVEFAEDVATFRRDFGDPAVLAPSDEERTRRAFEALGFHFAGKGASLELEPLGSSGDRRRQNLLTAFGLAVETVREQLSAGRPVTVGAKDERAPLPFGLAAWRETLKVSDRSLTAENAFVFFVKNVKASRMLVALSTLDPETRDAVRALRGAKGASGWRLLFDDAYDEFTRHPEALRVKGGDFVLPGGREGEAVWADVVGVPPSDRVRFLTALFRADGGKAAYVVASLRPLSDDDARRFVLMAGKGEAPGTRFKRFYRAIEGAGANFERALRDPYDFAHLVRFLRLGPDGEPTLPGGAAIWRAALDSSGFPRTKEELATAVAEAKKRPDDALAFFERLLERDVAGAVASVPAQKRFLLVSSLVERRPALKDPGVILLLFRGLESFLPLYDALADLPLDSPADVENVLFTFRRLDNSSERRPDELRAGLFQASMNLLADLARSGGLGAEEVRGLTARLVALPIFASDDPELPDVLPGFGDFLDDGLLEALRSAEARSVSTRDAEEGRRRAEYRAALDARNARVLEAFRRRHPSRSEAEEKLHSLLSPVCPPDDALFGPFAPRYTLERQWLAAALAKEGLAPGRAEERAAVILNEAIAAERARTRAGGDEPLRIEGEVEGTFAYADQEEPLPRFASLGESAPQATADDLLRAALAGWRGSVTFTWRGGRYRYDPIADEIARRKRFVEHQRLGTLEAARTARRHRRALLEAAAQGKLPEARREATAVADALVLDGAPSPDPRVARLERAAQETLERMQTIRKPAGLSRVPEHLRAMDAVIGERTLEALLGHAYAASAGDANNVYYQDADFVRRHSFHFPFRPTALRAGDAGQGFTIGGALSGLPDVLGLLHAEQLVYRPGASIPNEEIRMGLIAPVARLSVARLDDDALRFVAASCDATEELAVALASRPERERLDAWESVGRDIVAAPRLTQLAGLGDPTRAKEDLPALLTPSDLYRIGRRLVSPRSPALPAVIAAKRAEAAWSALVSRYGEAGAHDRLAEFGPRPATFAGRFSLADMDLPPYETLATYRVPLLLADRLYDLKIVLARRAAEAGIPAALLPILVAPALDETLARASLSFAYDWEALVRDARLLSASDVERYLDTALNEGRIVREGTAR